MKVEFINKFGGKMFVDESRVEEYKAAGYILAANVVSTDEKPTEIEEKPKRKRKKTGE